jgi:hypothetical protein
MARPNRQTNRRLLSSGNNNRERFAAGIERYRTQIALARRGCFQLGTTDAGAPLWLSPELFNTHVMLQAPTGHGKTFLSRAIFRELAPKSVALFCDDPKGDYVLDLEEDCAALRLDERVSVFDTSDPFRTLVLNPLKKNGIPVEDQTEWLLDAIRQSFRQDNFDETPQRPRWMFNALLPVIEGEGTFDDVLGMLDYTQLNLRRVFIERTSNPLVRKEWLSYQELSASRRREETNSAFAWLRKFCINTTTRRIFMPSPHAFDFGQFLRTGGIHLQRIMRRRPLSEEQVNFVRSVSLSMLLANAFHIPLGERPPLYVVLDEAEHLLAREPEHGGVIETILNEGRSLGIHLILIFHTFAQVAKTNPALLATVLTNCRTKIIGGHLTQPDLEILSSELFVKDWHPHIVRDEITALEVEPVETTREQRSVSRSKSRGRSLALPESVSDGTSESRARGSNQSVTLGIQHSRSEARARGTSRGRSSAVGQSISDVDSWAESDAEGEHWAEGDSDAASWAESNAMSLGENTAMGQGTVTTPDGEELTMTAHEMAGSSAAFMSGMSAGGSHVHSLSSGGSMMHASTRGGARGVTNSVSTAESEAEHESRATGKTTGGSFTFHRF